MSSRVIGKILLTAVCCGWVLSGIAVAQESGEVVEANVERRDLDIGAIEAENFELTGFLGYMSVEDFDSDVVWGFRGAYHFSPALFGEVSYGKVDAGKSSVERAGGRDPLTSSSRDLEYYDVSLGWNVLPGEVYVGPGKAWNSALYIIGGIGKADFGGEDETALNVGFGFRVLPRDSFSVRLDFRNYMFDTDVTGDDKSTNNLQATLNLGWYF
jgi:outer membrane beta-barrel protein